MEQTGCNLETRLLGTTGDDQQGMGTYTPRNLAPRSGCASGETSSEIAGTTVYRDAVGDQRCPPSLRKW